MVKLQQALERLERLGVTGGGRDEQMRRATLLLLSLFTCLAGAACGLFYWALNLPQVALAPFGYVLFVVASIVAFVASGHFVLFARIQLGLLLLLPFVVQWQLGGFVPAGAVMLWSILAPIGAFIFLGAGQGWVWFGAYLTMAAASLAFDLLRRPPTLPVGSPVASGTLALDLTLLNVLAASFVIFAILAYALSALRREQATVEQLLLNVFPAAVAERMRAGETAIADSFEEATILFADVVGFTRLAAALPASEVVRLLDRIFTAFDGLVERWGVEKIKTVGDAYMVASGLPLVRHDHAAAAAEVALAMRDTLRRIALEEDLPLELRIGLHSGPVVAGVIGRRRFAYDVWGDTVNVASRLESTAPPGTIRVSERTARALETLYALEARQAVSVRGRGEVLAFLLAGRRAGGPDMVYPVPRSVGA